MKPAIILTLIVLLDLPVPSALAGECCQPNQYYNWAQVQRQNQTARLRGIQRQQWVCRNIKSSGRRVLWTGC
jgi:hypothetical protein